MMLMMISSSQPDQVFIVIHQLISQDAVVSKLQCSSSSIVYIYLLGILFWKKNQ